MINDMDHHPARYGERRNATETQRGREMEKKLPLYLCGSVANI
jgi:hypothetical protein